MSVTNERYQGAYFESEENKYINLRGEKDWSLAEQASHISRMIRKVQEFLAEKFNLLSLNDKKKIEPIKVVWDAHYSTWDCSSYMGGKQYFCTIDKDLRYEGVAYKAIRAIFSSLRPLNRFGESGALYVSFADVFCVAFKHWFTQKVHDWEILDHDLSMHPKPFLPTGKPCLENDQGHIHENSAIPNHAFYIAVQYTNEKFPRVNPHELIAKIWFKAFLNISTNETFRDFAKKTVAEAAEYLPTLAQVVKESWQHVEVLEGDRPPL